MLAKRKGICSSCAVFRLPGGSGGWVVVVVGGYKAACFLLASVIYPRYVPSEPARVTEECTRAHTQPHVLT